MTTISHAAINYGVWENVPGTNNSYLITSSSQAVFGSTVPLPGYTLTVNGPTSIGGTNTNDNAIPGSVGEYVNSINTYPNSFPATTVWGDCTSITLSTGDWDVSLNLTVAAQGTTTTDIEYGISQTPGNSIAGLVLANNWNIAPSAAGTSTNDTFGVIVDYRQLLSVTTVEYGKVMATYTGGIPLYGCRLTARRIR